MGKLAARLSHASVVFAIAFLIGPPSESPLRPSIANTPAAWRLSVASAQAQSAPRPKSKRAQRAAKAASGPVVEVLTPSISPAEAQARARARVRIVIYTTKWCGICKAARAYLQSQDIAFVEHDVERSRAARARHRALNPSGSVPTFDIDGQVLTGFSAESFEQLLNNAAQARTDQAEQSGPKTFEIRWE